VSDLTTEKIETLPDLAMSDLTPTVTLGTGSFGVVKLVKHTNGNVYALKFLMKTHVIQLKQVEHIKSEKNIMAAINHPNIVNYVGSFQDMKYLYICMEFVQGGEFFTHLRSRGKFPNEVARFYAAQVVKGLAHLHGRNIIYRDLKPENLLLDKFGNCKITDFGFAKQIEYKTWTLCGTPEYLAPEIILQKGHNKAVDYWAVGILIYEMLAGSPPFYAEDPLDVYRLILRGDLKFPWHFDKAARDLIKRLLQPDVTKRFGCLKNGANDIMQHKWFEDIDWSNLDARQTNHCIVPKIKGGAADTSNFDRYPEEADMAQPISDEEQNMYFADF